MKRKNQILLGAAGYYHRVCWVGGRISSRYDLSSGREGIDRWREVPCAGCGETLKIARPGSQ